MQRGKFVILVMVSVALALALFAMWYRYQQGRRALRLWGVESAQLIRHSSQVELLTLGKHPGEGQGETLEIAGQIFRIVKQEDVSRARGLVHARHALIEDASFDWNGNTAECRGDWSYALRFSDSSRTITLALDLECGRALLLSPNADVRLVPRISRALSKYIADHFEGAPRPAGK